MRPTYSVTIDPARSLLRMTLEGFFDIATARCFIADRDAAVRTLNCGPGRHVTLCDIARQKVSTPEVAAFFGVATTDPRFASRRLAIVIHKALERRQTQRTVARDKVAYFETVAAAERWLFDEDPERPQSVSGDKTQGSTAAR